MVSNYLSIQIIMKKRKTQKINPERLQRFGFAYAPPLIISAAENNKAFDTLQTGPKTDEQIKKQLGDPEQGLRAFMDGIVRLERIKQDRHARYSLKPDT